MDVNVLRGKDSNFVTHVRCNGLIILIFFFIGEDVSFLVQHILCSRRSTST
jgi:hypothetical protein